MSWIVKYHAFSIHITPTLFTGLVIEEIEEDGTNSIQSESRKTSSAEYSVSEPVEASERTQNGGPYPGVSTADADCLKSLRENPEAMRYILILVFTCKPLPFINKLFSWRSKKSIIGIHPKASFNSNYCLSFFFFFFLFSFLYYWIA